MQTHLKKFQRRLRSNMPAPEIIIWQKIRSNQLGIKFRRQYVIDKYILDFYAPQIKLAIEIDGDSHFELEVSKVKDKNRDAYLCSQGIKTIRFLNIEILENLPGCLEKVVQIINSSPT